MKTILSTFQGPGGDISSKRVFGVACLVVAIVVSFTTQDVAMTALWLGTGAGIFGVQAITKT